MKRCPFCAEEIQDAALVCRFCNRDLPTGASHVPAAATSNAATTAGKALGLGCLGVVGFVVILAIVGSLSNGSSDTPSATDAYFACQQFVEKRLRAPASAKFPLSSDTDAVTLRGGAGGEYDVTAYVDSQNGFGALIRSAFTCTVTYLPDEKSWRLTSLDVK